MRILDWCGIWSSHGDNGIRVECKKRTVYRISPNVILMDEYVPVTRCLVLQVRALGPSRSNIIIRRKPDPSIHRRAP